MKRLLLTTFLILAIAAAGVFYFKDQLFPKFAVKNVEESPQQAEARDCLVLVDNLTTKDGTPLGMGPGEIVMVKGLAEEGAFYKIDDPAPNTLIPSAQCFLFDSQSLFDNFLNSTGEVSEFFGRSDATAIPPDESAKFAILNDRDFLRKAALNPKSKVANWARFYAWHHLPEGDRMTFLGEMFEKTPSLLEVSQPMPSSPLAQEDLNVYSKFNKTTKLAYVSHYCQAAETTVPSIEFILQDADDQSLDDVFDAALSCLKQKHHADEGSFLKMKLKSAARQQRLKEAISHLENQE